MAVLTNHQLAELLRARAQHLAREGANVYRVRALRRAALVLLGLPWEAAELATPQGRKVLERIPGIGRGIARTLCEWVRRAHQEAESASVPVPCGEASSFPSFPRQQGEGSSLPVRLGEGSALAAQPDVGSLSAAVERSGSETQPVG
jgi:DNA polymerase/3'-5' exonuclease PolX